MLQMIITLFYHLTLRLDSTGSFTTHTHKKKSLSFTAYKSDNINILKLGSSSDSLGVCNPLTTPQISFGGKLEVAGLARRLYQTWHSHLGKETCFLSALTPQI